jgi:hypothetical protein
LFVFILVFGMPPTTFPANAVREMVDTMQQNKFNMVE